MNIYLSDDEQMHKIKEWIKKNGIIIVIGITVFFATNFAWRYWHKHNDQLNSKASILYEQVMIAHLEHNYDEVKIYTQRLQNDYAKTPYASLAALISAENAVTKKDLPVAEQNLQWIIDHGKNTGFKQIARLRLARVLTENKQLLSKALAVLNVVEDKAYLAKIHEAKGDIYLAMGEKNLSLQEYKMAADSIVDNNVAKAIIDIKINQLL